MYHRPPLVGIGLVLSSILSFMIVLLYPFTGASVSGLTSTPSESSPNGNFYHWVNAEWLDTTAIPPDKPMISNFELIQLEVNLKIRKLLDGLRTKPGKTDDEQKIITLYDSFIDLDRRESLGLSPLKQELSSIDSSNSPRDIALLFARLQRIGVPTPIIFDVTTDLKDSGRNIIFLSQSGLGIEREVLINEDKRSQTVQRQYRILLEKLFRLASIEQPESLAEEVLTLERDLARIQWSNTDSRNVTLISNVSDYPALLAKTPALYLGDQFAALGIPENYPVNLTQPSYVEAFNRFFPSRSIKAWKAYLKARLLTSYAKLLDSRFRKSMVDYEIARGLYASEQPIPLQAIDYLSDNAGLLLGKYYVEKTFSETEKQKIAGIVKAIVDQYRIAIGKSSRLEPETRRKALSKLEKMTFRIGYPDHWKDYTALKPVAGQPAENHKRLRSFEFEHRLSKLGNPVDTNDWEYPPQIVNAFYAPTSNSFVLLAAILNPPFYSADASDAKIYGGIGFIIGHEIGHGFDDQGSNFDEHGNLRNWWTKTDSRHFYDIKRNLINQANAYEIMPGRFLKGELEIGEIIGDLSGSETAFNAYLKTAQAKGEDSPENRRHFFEQLARTWRAKIRPEFTILLLDTNPHPPSEFRANGIVRNFDEFHKLFGTKPGDRMYLPPDQRVTMW